MRELELGDGYAMPVFGPMHCHGTVSIGRAVNPEVLDTAPVAELHMVAQAAHMRLCALMPDLQGPEKRLSAREQEILDWVARGKSNNDIASIVGLSTGTVDTYLRRIYDKLGVSDRTSAAVRGVGMGLIIAK
jgi:DNA-binding NarL/FixJ family response regulator